MNASKVKAKLRKAGFDLSRNAASHSVWCKGPVTISVPTGHSNVSAGVMRKVDNAIKEGESHG